MGGSGNHRSEKGTTSKHFSSGVSGSSGTRSRSICYSYHYPSVSPEGEDRTFPDIYNVGGAGLGYRIGEEEEEGGVGLGLEKTNSSEDEIDDEEKEEEEEDTSRNEGHITIAGVRVYTEDCSSHESVPQTENSDGEPDDSDSSCDEEMASDYLEGISGGNEFLKAEWLAGKKSLGNDFGISESDCTSDDEKLTGVQMMRVSEEYGMPKKTKKKIHFIEGSSEIIDIDLCSAMDDLMPGKDLRMISGRKKKKNVRENAQLARSTPKDGKSKRFSPGDKKKHHKELIAAKRRQRMINRGVDLEQINLRLKQMVIDGTDIFSFHPMHHRDCTQVQRLASIYGLRSGCKGSGKKRFVTVTRTAQTCLPSAHDKLRLDKLLGKDVEEENFTIPNKIKGTPRTQPRGGPKSKTKLFLHDSAPPKLTYKNNSNANKKPTFSERPVSFISSGIMETDPQTETKVSESTETITTEVSSTSNMGAFEMHTKGFGSKMMAKMGFVEGSGLGKDGQGIVQPVQTVQRPKSLGLGVQFHEVGIDDSNTESSSGSKSNCKNKKTESYDKQDRYFGKNKSKGKKIECEDSIGAFEKHTKGFGSKMMGRMGFVEGNGLGRDGQGMVNPLTAVRGPKCRGLGSKS